MPPPAIYLLRPLFFPLFAFVFARLLADRRFLVSRRSAMGGNFDDLLASRPSAGTFFGCIVVGLVNGLRDSMDIARRVVLGHNRLVEDAALILRREALFCFMQVANLRQQKRSRRPVRVSYSLWFGNIYLVH